MTNRWLPWLAGCVTMLCSSAGLQGAGPSQQVSGGVSGPANVIQQYCGACHNERAKIAGLALDTMNVAQVAEHADVWEKVVRKLRGRMMPPPGRPRPDEAGRGRRD